MGIKAFGKKIKGFDRPDAVISGVESRTSSPIRMERGETFESSVAGFYPCGEGAGYAGGITSAAMDGIKAVSYTHLDVYKRQAENLISELLKLENPYHCPHGRPTIISMTKYEIEKKFKRIL